MRVARYVTGDLQGHRRVDCARVTHPSRSGFRVIAVKRRRRTHSQPDTEDREWKVPSALKGIATTTSERMAQSRGVHQAKASCRTRVEFAVQNAHDPSTNFMS
ncbi:hypothetical protein BAUCODRAFT_386501 [Baudoinia panamericana UAMH 10762]|uniref:Uncharacterized protein n=1 Tax=Baudoinia panamericana (strain UAMH 10762) TaxID=717646 RepID=M2NIQ2_BAUPA|nr:uncharacterized protein BAUCODRAFT_386501 [Baudoinia panamericana UAMH 10762]EMC98970.1 hypothetical protein BAUCODRAFT_386501 [Baudoinia panamericana UAMH 10762]